MGAKDFQKIGPRFFDMSSASGYMGEKYFQEFGPRFLDMSYCQKGSHLQRGVDFCCQTGLHRGVIIMISRVGSGRKKREMLPIFLGAHTCQATRRGAAEEEAEGCRRQA